MKNKGISNLLSYITISIVILIIGFSIYYIVLQQAKYGQQIAISEERKAESQLAEKLSLIYWGVDGVIVANDGENSVIITKIYLDNQIITTNVIINPYEKKQINIPYGENLMFESSSGAMIKLEKPKPTITEPYYYSETQESRSSGTQQQTSQTQSYSKTTYTSTITTEIPITTYSIYTTITSPTSTSYRTITSISYSTTLTPITTMTSYYIEPTYPYRVIYYTSTIFSTISTPITTITSTSFKLYNTTITFAFPYITYKTTTYITIIDPIIYPILDNSNVFLISIFLFALIFVCLIIFNLLFEEGIL
jgi:hypothetical protein